MLNIVIPMAGLGSRFSKQGYLNPKPLINVNGVPMIKVVIDNLRPISEHRFVFVCQNQHLVDYALAEKLSQWAPGCEVVGIDGVTDGAACTVLAARNYIDNDSPLMISNCDQFVDANIDEYVNVLDVKKLDGLIMTMKANDPKWSFVGMNGEQLVTTVVEKEVISDEATVGIYNFAKGSDFVSSADSMIMADQRVNGEFYVAPVYNAMISRGKRIGIFNVGEEGGGMYGLGTPSDLELFLNLPISLKVAELGGEA